jgi:hypothetical protein
VTADDVRLLLYRKIEEEGTCAGFARKNNVDRSVIQDFLKGREENPQPKVLAALGLRKRVEYEPEK